MDRMPVGKATKKKIQQNKLSTQVAATQSVHDVTVRDCLMWPDGRKKQTSAIGQDDIVYVSLRQQQQQQQCQSSGQLSQASRPAPPEDDATVGDALRGWPRYMKQCEQAQLKTDNDADNDLQKQAPAKTKTGHATKPSKSKSKSNVTKEKDEDIHVADLISQRFLHEYMEQREAEMERDRKKKEAREKAAREGRRAAKDRTDIKANKAAQLRAIALADRVEASPFDLWKMEKFTRAARPHVSTFRTGQGSTGASAGAGAVGVGYGRRGGRGGGRGGGGRYGGGGLSGRSSGPVYDDDDDDEEAGWCGELVGACTCPDKLSYYDARDVYDSYDACADGCITTDVDQFNDAADCAYSYVETSISAL